MRRTENLLLLYCPCPSREVALRLARLLVEQRLVACANILPEMTSIFSWEGTVQETSECLLLAKTTAEQREAATDVLVREHPYDCPAVLALSAAANPDFTAWVAASCC